MLGEAGVYLLALQARPNIAVLDNSRPGTELRLSYVCYSNKDVGIQLDYVIAYIRF